MERKTYEGKNFTEYKELLLITSNSHYFPTFGIV